MTEVQADERFVMVPEAARLRLELEVFGPGSGVTGGREKELDDYRAGVKARYRAKQEKLIVDAREAIRLRD